MECSNSCQFGVMKITLKALICYSHSDLVMYLNVTSIYLAGFEPTIFQFSLLGNLIFLSAEDQEMFFFVALLKSRS